MPAGIVECQRSVIHEDSKNPKEEHARNGIVRVPIVSEMDSGPDHSIHEDSAMEPVTVHQFRQEQSAKNDFF